MDMVDSASDSGSPSAAVRFLRIRASLHAAISKLVLIRMPRVSLLRPAMILGVLCVFGRRVGLSNEVSWGRKLELGFKVNETIQETE